MGVDDRDWLADYDEEMKFYRNYNRKANSVGCVQGCFTGCWLILFLFVAFVFLLFNPQLFL